MNKVLLTRNFLDTFMAARLVKVSLSLCTCLELHGVKQQVGSDLYMLKSVGVQVIPDGQPMLQPLIHLHLFDGLINKFTWATSFGQR